MVNCFTEIGTHLYLKPLKPLKFMMNLVYPGRWSDGVLATQLVPGACNAGHNSL